MLSLKSFYFAAIIGVFSASAMSQSNVSIYGRISSGVEYQKNSGVFRWAEVDNNSRFGFRGSEDLGGGTKAGFALESGFASDTGTSSGGSTFFNRRSEVFLSQQRAGTLRLGRWTSDAYFATADYVGLHNHDTGTSSDMLYAGFQRTNNTVGYRTPEVMAGLVATFSSSLGEGVSKSLQDFSLDYKSGGLALGAGYNSFISVPATTINGKARQAAVRALYTTGPFAFGGYYQRDENARALGKRDNIRLVGMYSLNAWEFHINAGAASDTGNTSNSKAQQLTLATNYNLSKRTKVFAFVTRLNDGGARLYGGDQRSLALGIRHNF